MFLLVIVSINKWENVNETSLPKKQLYKFRIISWYWYVITSWKSIRWGIWHAIYQYAKANNKQLKDYDKNKESSYFKYCDVNNLYGWPITQKLPVNKFEWIKDTASLNENFIKRKWLMTFSQSCSLICWRITWFS